MPPWLTEADLLALAVFAASWLGYSLVVDIPAIHRRSVLAAMDRHRLNWMLAMAERDNRIGDVNIVGNLMNSTSFLANTSIFVLGGLLAMLGSAETGSRILGALPFAEVPDASAWQLRIGLLLLIFVRAFFVLTWALRQFNYCSIVVGSVPPGCGTPQHTARAEAAARLVNRGARRFNSGLRAYYFGMAALAWLIHPYALISASLLVVLELYRREFRSDILEALRS
jgi:uncharacterized membrane protein